MTFLHPQLLWALPFGLVPIIIYYLMRYRSLKVVWGANYVLELALARLKKRMYLDQFLLLALRTLAALALVVAFARPASYSRQAALSGSGVHHVLLVDASYSMLAGEAGRSRWERSREAMKQLLATWGRGERWSLCLLGDQPEWVVDGAAVSSPAQAAGIIDGLTIREAKASIARGLDAVQKKLAGQTADLYLFADDQAESWKDVEASPAAGPGLARSYWLNPPLEDRRNAAVVSARFASDATLVGHPARLFVRVRNFSDLPILDLAVELLVDGAFVSRETRSLLPRQDGSLYFDVTFDKPGSHYATVRLGADTLTFDNQLAAGIEVRERLNVLVLRDADKTRKFDSAWDFFDLAAAAEKQQDEEARPVFAAGPLVFTLCQDREPPARLLTGADAVFLDGSRAFTPGLASLLRDYVAGGGALVLAADERVDVAAWNRLLGNGGLLPAPVGPLHTLPIGGPTYQSMTQSGLVAGALRAFESAEDGDLGESRFYTWHDLGPVPAGSTVLATFADGRPCLVVKRFEPGAVALLAGGLSGSGDNLIVREFFLPFLFRLFSDALGHSVYPRTVACREPVRLRFPGNAQVRSVTFQADEQRPVPVTPQKRRQDWVAAVPGGSDHTGLCAFILSHATDVSRVWVGVQGERMDSDLTPLDLARKKAIVSRLKITEVADWPQLRETIRAGSLGAEWHAWLSLALLALLLGEMVIQRRFV